MSRKKITLWLWPVLFTIVSACKAGSENDASSVALAVVLGTPQPTHNQPSDACSASVCITSSNPASGATSVPVSSTLQVTFQSAINPATFTINKADTTCSSSNVQLSRAADNFSTCFKFNVAWSVTWESGDTILKIIPAGMANSFAAATQYLLSITGGVKDTKGNSVVSKIITFTTQ